MYDDDDNMSDSDKPAVQLSGQDGNVFNLIGLAKRAMERAGQRTQAQEMMKKCMSSKSYDEAIQTIMEYCDVT